MVTALRPTFSSSDAVDEESRRGRAELDSCEASTLIRSSASDSARKAAATAPQSRATAMRVVLASLTFASLILLASITMHPLIHTLTPSPLPTPPSSHTSPPPPTSPSPSANLLSPTISRYELCPRAPSPADERNFSLTSLNHHLLPHGVFSFSSANLSTTPLHVPPPRTQPIHSYLEVYIQETLYLPHLDQLQVAVIALPGGELARKNLLYDWERSNPALDLMAAGLSMTSSLSGGGVRVGVGQARLVGQVYWWHFPLRWERKGEPLPDHFTVDLHHDHFQSTSSHCAEDTDTPWCRRAAAEGVSTSPSAPFLRVAVCLRAYSRVSLSMCSSALHSPAVMPHLRSWLTYHAALGVERFIIYDHGYYEEALRPYVDAGLVDRRYWPLPNRDFSHDSGADFSQLALLVVCGTLADVTSDYVIYFDTDEWLNFPTHDLVAEDLKGALPSEAELQPLQQATLAPSTCLSFRKSELTVDPDVRVELSAYTGSTVPALRCESVLKSFLSAYRLLVIRRKRAQLQQLHAQLMQATSAEGEEYAALTSKYSKLRTSDPDPVEFPIFVYNFVETDSERRQREAEELSAQEQRSALVRAHNASTGGGAGEVVHFYAAAPQRFHRRLRYYRVGGDHKAIYRTPVRRDLWIHPLNPLDDYVNPNNLRINHYGSIIRTRWTTDNPQVTHSPHITPHDAAHQPTIQHPNPAESAKSDSRAAASLSYGLGSAVRCA